MSTLIAQAPCYRLPSSNWRAVIKAWRKAGGMEAAVGLLLRAGRGALEGDVEEGVVLAALELCGQCCWRNGTRARRLRGLLRRVRAGRPRVKAAVPVYCLVGMTQGTLTVRRTPGAKGLNDTTRARGPYGEMETLRKYALRNWARLTGGREVEAAAAEIAAGAMRPREQPLPFEDEIGGESQITEERITEGGESQITKTP